MEPTEVIDNFWSELDEIDCPCKGSGWATRDDKTETCAIHFSGQLHPDSKALLLDEPKKLAEEERRSHLQWKISQSQQKINTLNSQLKYEQFNLSQLHLELINRTPTTKLNAVVVPLEAMGTR